MLMPVSTVDPVRAEDYWNRELETRPWPKLELWQAAHIARFIETLRATSDFYQPRLAAQVSPLRSFAALEQYGFTTRADIERAQAYTPEWMPFGSIQNADSRHIIQAGSSTSRTGTVLHYALTQRDTEVWTDAIAQTLYTCGVRADHVVAHTTALPAGLPFADALRRLGATLLPAGGEATPQLLERMQKLRVNRLLAEGARALHLAECCQQWQARSLAAAGIGHILSAGEPSTADAQLRIEQVSGCRVHACMGIEDVMPGMWGACGHAGGMHFNAQRYVAVELIDPASGAQLAWREGAEGEAVYTTFEREATPLLRFRSGDRIAVTALGCACARSSPKVQYLGRIGDRTPRPETEAARGDLLRAATTR